MRVNIYAEEMTTRVEIIEKVIDGQTFTGVRFYLYLPVSTGKGGKSFRGPFMHRDNDDDSSAVTFWGKTGLHIALCKAIDLLDAHHKGR